MTPLSAENIDILETSQINLPEHDDIYAGCQESRRLRLISAAMRRMNRSLPCPLSREVSFRCWQNLKHTGPLNVPSGTSANHGRHRPRVEREQAGLLRNLSDDHIDYGIEILGQFKGQQTSSSAKRPCARSMLQNHRDCACHSALEGAIAPCAGSSSSSSCSCSWR